MENSKKNYLDVFIKGETIDLCAPLCDENILSQWFKWFNDSDITTYLSQGVYPNTIESQRNYCNNLMNDSTRLVTLIKPKSKDKIIGVASLSSIDYIQKQCDFAMVIGDRSDDKGSLFYGLEAKARLTQHAFDKVGVERINSGQVVNLKEWQKWQILFGYQIEGLLRNKFVKGSSAYDVYMSSCLAKDFKEIVSTRDGILWPGKSKMLELMRLIPKNTLIDELSDWLPDKQEKYWKSIIG